MAALALRVWRVVTELSAQSGWTNVRWRRAVPAPYARAQPMPRLALLLLSVLILALSGCETTSVSADGCHPSYEGACLDASASDYDCEGGSGNGPRYVSGPVDVVGSDDFDLDRDGNGVGCESY